MQLTLQSYLDHQWCDTAVLNIEKPQGLMTQADFATWVGISRRSLTQLENDGSNPTVGVLSRLFRPFGLMVGFTPMRSIKERLEAIAQALD